MPFDQSYRRLPDDELLTIVDDFSVKIDDFLNRGLDYSSLGVKYTVCGMDIIDAIIRTDKRIHYFRVFHNMDVNESKKAALYAYWIVKFRPIKIVSEAHRNVVGYNDHVNELFAIHYLLSALVGVGRVKLWDGHEGVDIGLDNPYIKELRYSLRFRNFTIDSMIVLADTLNTETLESALSRAAGTGKFGQDP